MERAIPFRSWQGILPRNKEKGLSILKNSASGPDMRGGASELSITFIPLAEVKA